MNIDFDQQILWLDGSPIPDGSTPEGKLTLAVVAAGALNRQPKGEMSPTVSLKRGMLAIRVFEGGTQDISPEEAAMIQQALPDAWAPVVVARAHQMLNG